ISIAKKWQEAGADMIHLVDLDATLGLGSNLELIKKIVSSVSIPVEIAGGLRSESLILEALDIVDRVVIGTFAACDKLGIQLHDHIIVAKSGANSFKTMGLL
ncbi:MAG: 1-(5-phosphoribosyl)-5-[(5-phosphoribosylamino)methylideneamino]imidazole-4-carboxamide isomerase, partial [Rhodospirillaceae bacterium]|nr:1-(5-phosphoribosyl)-5-[(5-phosphoribosylamino)methylideneamino]imidazole-4-carboxamide isomerase [Rhodospirillaceae bacterium]